MGRTLTLLGVALVALGIAWPWLAKLGGGLRLFHLPGDIVIQRPGFSFYFPLTSGLLISGVITLILWLFRR